jgi:hypothetical protein
MQLAHHFSVQRDDLGVCFVIKVCHSSGRRPGWLRCTDGLALSGSRHRVAAGIGGNQVLLATQQPTTLLGKGEARRCGRRELRRRPGLQRDLYRRGLRSFDRHRFSLADEADGP